MLDDDGFMYDLSAVKKAIAKRIPDGGTMKWHKRKPRGAAALLIPPGGSIGSPILLTISGDEVRIQAGLGARISLGGVQSGDEDIVADVIGAVIDGRAVEHAIRDLDGDYVMRLEVRGDRVAMSPKSRKSLRVRALPPW